ncbi:MAG: AAA family ATPase [Acidimicrobiia bacterium]|nr:AAA family ATPase [Acidimicrobiia bacterium]
MIPVLWVTGPPGVGKTSVAWDLAERLHGMGADPAYVDVDQLGICTASPEGDPHRHRLKERNVAALRRNFSVAGARLLVVSGVVDPARGPDVDRLGGSGVGVVRLRADPDVLRARLRDRSARLTRAEGSSVHEDGALEVAEAFDRSGFADWSVDTTAMPVDEVVGSVLSVVGASIEPGPHPVADELPLDPTSIHGELLWVAGPTGVGKSTIGFRAYSDVARTGSPVAFIDVDQLGFCRAAASSLSLRAQNVAALCRNVVAVGVRRAVVVGDVGSRAEAALFERELPDTDVTWCRLQVDDAELTRRIVGRGVGGSWAQPGDPLRGRSEAELVSIADRAIATAPARRVGLAVDVDGMDVAAAADHLLRTAHWPAEHAAWSDC